uniref:Uncharacterized protein n=1 Tax=Lepeophtheirus salmonis TaxID=72036 RepID=A0A0K2UWQ7_LEPSM
MQCVKFMCGATCNTLAFSPFFFPSIAPAPSVHTPMQFSQNSPFSFSLLSSFSKMSSPVHVPSSGEQNSMSSFSFPSKLYLTKTSSWAELDISVDSSSCKAYFPPFILSTSWHIMSWAMSVMRQAIVPFDSGTDSSSRANLSPCMAQLTAIAAGLIKVSPIVCGFLACAIKYATSYEAL